MQVNPFTLISKNKFIVEDYESLAGQRRESPPQEAVSSWEDRLYKDSAHANRYGFIPKLIREAANEPHPKETETPKPFFQENNMGKISNKGNQRLSSTVSSHQLGPGTQSTLPKITRNRQGSTHQQGFPNGKASSTASLLSNERSKKSLIEEEGEEQKPKEDLKLKKDTLKEYINRKREIFLSKMNIDLKTKATDKLSDFIQNQEEGLNATISDMRNDAKMVNYFIQKLEQDVKNLAADLKRQEKEKNDSHNMFIRIKNEGQIMQQSIKNIDEELKIFEDYRRFIIAIAQYAEIPLMKDENEGEEVEKEAAQAEEPGMFITATDSKQHVSSKSLKVHLEEKKENEQNEEKINRILAEIMQNPLDFLGILRKIEEENLRIIEKTQNMAEDLTVLDMALENSKSEYRTKLGDLENNIKLATKQKEELEKDILSRKDMKRRNFESSNAMKINDSSKELDPVLMCDKIKEIFVQLFPENKYKQDIRDLDRIEAIEKVFEKYKKKELENLQKNREEYFEVQQLYMESMKKAGNEKSREKMVRQQEENKRKQKEKFEKPITIHKGRKDVYKHKIKKSAVKTQDDKIDFEKIEEERFCSWAPITQTEQLKYFEDMGKEPYLSKHGMKIMMEAEKAKGEGRGGTKGFEGTKTEEDLPKENDTGMNEGDKSVEKDIE